MYVQTYTDTHDFQSVGRAAKTNESKSSCTPLQFHCSLKTHLSVPGFHTSPTWDTASRERLEQKQNVDLGPRAVAQGGRSPVRARQALRPGEEGEPPGPAFREARRVPRNGTPACTRAHRRTHRFLSKSAFHLFYKLLRIQSEHFLR